MLRGLAAVLLAATPAWASERCESVVHFSGAVTDCRGRVLLFADRSFLAFFETGNARFEDAGRAERIIAEAAAHFDQLRRIAAGEVPDTRLEAEAVFVHVVAYAPDVAAEAEAVTLAAQRARVVAERLGEFGVPPNRMVLSAKVDGGLLDPSDPAHPVNRAVVLLFRSDAAPLGLQPVQP